MTPLKERRRKQILEAALQVFSQDGYHKGTVSNIALAAGIGKGTIYEYFTSKKNIFEEMILYALDHYVNLIDEKLRLQESVRDKIKYLLQFNIEFIDRHMEVIKKVFFSIDNISKDFEDSLTSFHDKLNNFIMTLIDEGVEKGEISPNIDRYTTSLVVVNMVYGLSGDSQRRKLEKPIDPDLVISILFNGIS